MSRFAKLLLCLIMFVVPMVTGCFPEQQLDGQPAAPFSDVGAMSDFFQKRHSNLSPLHATGDGFIEYQNNSGKTLREGIIRYDLLFVPTDKVYLSADHLLQKKVMRFGSDGSEFWAWLRLPEKSEYFWGDQELLTNRCRMPFALRPDVIMDAFGVADLNSLMLSDKLQYANGSYYFTLDDIEGKPVKRYYLTNDGKVKLVEYFDESGKVYLTLDLEYYKFFSNYKKVQLPAKIELKSLTGDYRIVIQIKNVKPFKATPQRVQKVFSRPSPTGNINIYRLNSDCRFVPQN